MKLHEIKQKWKNIDKFKANFEAFSWDIKVWIFLWYDNGKLSNLRRFHKIISELENILFFFWFFVFLENPG